ncbi:MAG: protein kinase domain-containing protein [Micromonosporaceae bacterium]
MGFPRPLGGRYRLDHLLGSGGTSEVWRGFDTVLDRPVAVKILAQTVAGDRRIRAEAQAAARVAHPNVAVVYDYGEEVDDHGGHVPYVVMELLRGQVLAARLREGRLPPELALIVGAQVAAALAAAQAYGLVHRDIKPGNVMLTQAGAKVVDFGIAAPIGRLDDADLNEPIMGSAAYVAPERLAGAPVTAASDVYALGVLLFRMLTDELPWQVSSAAELVHAHVSGEPAALPELDGVPPTVGGLVAACLSRKPHERPSAAEVATVLAAAAGIPVPVSENPAEPLNLDLVTMSTAPVLPGPSAAGARGSAPRPARRTTLVAISAAVVLIAGVALAVLALTHPRAPAPVRSGPGFDGTTVPLDPGRASGPAPAGTPGPSQPIAGDGGAAGPVSGGDTTPGSPRPPMPTPSKGQPAPSAVQRTLTSPGGFVVATCVGPKLTINSVVPASGYWVQSTTTHGGTSSSVTFATSGSQVVMSVVCQNGVPFDVSPTGPA